MPPSFNGFAQAFDALAKECGRKDGNNVPKPAAAFNTAERVKHFGGPPTYLQPLAAILSERRRFRRADA